MKRYHLAVPELSGIVHRVRKNNAGELVSMCGVSEWNGDGLAASEGPTTCQRCLRSEEAINR